MGDFQKFYEANGITFIRKCPSPSRQVRGNDHEDELYLLYKTTHCRSAHTSI